jgi:ParB family transcriptional regulator, chromosome partitioning protein
VQRLQHDVCTGLGAENIGCQTCQRLKCQNALDQGGQKKSQLLKKLQEAEQQQDFYTGLYRQYTTNLLKLVIYVRTLLNNAEVKAYCKRITADLAQIFEEILASTEG